MTRSGGRRQREAGPPALSAGNFGVLQPPLALRGARAGSRLPAPAVLRHCRLMARLDLKEKKKKIPLRSSYCNDFLGNPPLPRFFLPPWDFVPFAARGFGPNTSLEGGEWYPGCRPGWANRDGRCFPGGRIPPDRGKSITLATPPASSGCCLLSGSWSGVGGDTHTTQDDVGKSVAGDEKCRAGWGGASVSPLALP